MAGSRGPLRDASERGEMLQPPRRRKGLFFAMDFGGGYGRDGPGTRRIFFAMAIAGLAARPGGRTGFTVA